MAATTLLAATGCSGGGDTANDGDASEATTATAAPGDTTHELDAGRLAGPLPPAEASALEPLYGVALEALGVRLVERGGLIDRTGGRYEPSPSGTHLALYVEPAAERPASAYTAGIVSLTQLLADDVFARWPQLESFDVCQQPPAGFDERREPVPVTQIELTRAQAAAFDWNTVTLGDIVAAAHATPPRLRLSVSSLVLAEPSYQAAMHEVRQRRS